jgi:hypothetical protein
MRRKQVTDDTKDARKDELTEKELEQASGGYPPDPCSEKVPAHEKAANKNYPPDPI